MRAILPAVRPRLAGGCDSGLDISRAYNHYFHYRDIFLGSHPAHAKATLSTLQG